MRIDLVDDFKWKVGDKDGKLGKMAEGEVEVEAEAGKVG